MTMELNEDGILVDKMRRITHPSFAAVAGDGIYTYLCNPAETLNFKTAPTKKVDTVLHKTLGGTVLVRQAEVDDDVVITEVWPGGGGKLSMPAAMFTKLWDFYTTIPAIGAYVSWEPRDVNDVAYDVEIVSLTLGGPDMNYFEHRPVLNSSEDAYLGETVTLQMKVVKTQAIPTGAITLVGR